MARSGSGSEYDRDTGSVNPANQPMPRHQGAIVFANPEAAHDPGADPSTARRSEDPWIPVQDVEAVETPMAQSERTPSVRTPVSRERVTRFSTQRAQVLFAMAGCFAVAGFLLVRAVGDTTSPKRFTMELVDMTRDNPLPPETTVWIGDEQWSDAMGTREFAIDTPRLVRIAVPEMITFTLDPADPSDLLLLVEDDRVALRFTSGEERWKTRANPVRVDRESTEERVDPSGPASMSFGDPPSTPATTPDEPASSFSFSFDDPATPPIGGPESFSFGDPSGPPTDGAASFSFGDSPPTLR